MALEKSLSLVLSSLWVLKLMALEKGFLFMGIKTIGIGEGSVFGPFIFLGIITNGIGEGLVFGPFIFLGIITNGIGEGSVIGPFIS